MNSVWQEIHCTTSGSGCGGFFIIKLDVALSGRVTMVCPKCQHRHERCIKNGQIVEEGRHNGDSQEDLCPTMAAWSATPRTKCMQDLLKKKDWRKERDGAIIRGLEDFITPPEVDPAQVFVRESWTEKFLGKVMGR